MDVEAEYQRIFNIRKRPDTRSYTSTVPLATPVAEAAAVPPSSPANTHKTGQEHSVGTLHFKTKGMGELVSKEVPTRF